MYKSFRKKGFDISIETLDEFGGFDNIHIFDDRPKGDSSNVTVLINQPIKMHKELFKKYEEIALFIAEKLC